jgi:Histidine phosphatase superfamily (branch 1)
MALEYCLSLLASPRSASKARSCWKRLAADRATSFGMHFWREELLYFRALHRQPCAFLSAPIDFSGRKKIPNLTTKIILTRHGHVEGIDPRRFRGRAEIPLTALGVAQAKATAERIAASWRPVKIYTSPMGRCVATGAAIAEVSSAENQILQALNDLDYGEWQWKTHDEVKLKSAALYQTWHTMPHLVRFPGGESFKNWLREPATSSGTC